MVEFPPEVFLFADSSMRFPADAGLENCTSHVSRATKGVAMHGTSVHPGTVRATHLTAHTSTTTATTAPMNVNVEARRK